MTIHVHFKIPMGNCIRSTADWLHGYFYIHSSFVITVKGWVLFWKMESCSSQIWNNVLLIYDLRVCQHDWVRPTNNKHSSLIILESFSNFRVFANFQFKFTQKWQNILQKYIAPTPSTSKVAMVYQLLSYAEATLQQLKSTYEGALLYIPMKLSKRILVCRYTFWCHY